MVRTCRVRGKDNANLAVLELSNMYGQIVKSQQLPASEQKTNLDISGLPAGMGVHPTSFSEIIPLYFLMQT